MVSGCGVGIIDSVSAYRDWNRQSDPYNLGTFHDFVRA